jgi:c-di-GMP-binding flagellar brake protein YcgR
MMFELLNTSENEILQEISKSFTRSPLLIYIATIGVVAIIIVLIATSIISRLTAKKIMLNQLFTKKKQLFETFKINEKEKKLIEKLSQFIENRNKQPMLLTDPYIFHGALNKLRKMETVDGLVLHPLEKKLGFQDFSPYKIIKSTHDIKNGSVVFIIFNNKRKIAGHVLESEEVVRIKVDDNDYTIQNGTNALLVTHNYTGFYEFYTSLKECKNNIMCFYHSNKTKAYQRRQFFRNHKKRIVTVQRKGVDVRLLKTTVLDLSGGGACIDNTKLDYKVSDEFEMHFPIDIDQDLTINAEVLRITDNGAEIHVKFNHLIPLFQDKIIKIVNS